jgi:flavin reductase (DIM6/NTAB) family NADH-FMN oxidoreductase RutF
MDYEEISIQDAYRLQNAGGMVLVCTKAASGYDLAPVAWCCPLDYSPQSRFICVLDTSHRTFEDLKASGEFILALPCFAQKSLVELCGSISGRDADKYARFEIPAFRGEKVDALIPYGVAGWVECKVSGIHVEGTSAVVYGDALLARAARDFWALRLHYVAQGIWFKPER